MREYQRNQAAAGPAKAGENGEKGEEDEDEEDEEQEEQEEERGQAPAAVALSMRESMRESMETFLSSNDTVTVRSGAFAVGSMDRLIGDSLG